MGSTPGILFNGQRIPASRGEDWMRLTPEQARIRQRQQTRQFLDDKRQEREDTISTASGYGDAADALDLVTGGGKQYALGLLAQKVAEGATGGSENPWLQLGAGLLAGGAVNKAGRAVRNEVRAAREAPGILMDRASSLAPYADQLEPDITKSLKSKYKGDTPIPDPVIQDALARRASMRAEPMPLGKPVSQATDAERVAFGQQHGVDLTANPMLPVVDPSTGRPYMDPAGKPYLFPSGGEKPFTLADVHQLQGQGYNPAKMPPALHGQIHRRIVEATDPGGKPSDAQVFRGWLFGLLSPNSPLLPNEFSVARLHPRTPEDMDKLASYTRGQKLTSKQKNVIDEQMARDYGISKAATGGMGVRQSPRPSAVSAFADKFQKYGDWFRKNDEESWQVFVERVSNELDGLKSKTGSMGGVWQSPTTADISAIDRWMARHFLPVIESHPERGPVFRKSAVDSWNAKAKRGDKVRNYDQLKAKEKGQNFVEAQIEKQINQTKGGQVRLKGGEFNPNVPEHLRNLPSNPKKVDGMGENYTAAIGENARLAKEDDMSVFMKQWGIWDPKRKRISTHPSMHRDATKLPALSGGELLDSFQTLKDAKYWGKGEVKPYDWKKGIFWTAPATGAGLGGLLGMGTRREEE